MDRYASFGILVILAIVPIPSPTSAFTLTWVDQFGETTYMLVGPDFVSLGDVATVTVSAADPQHPGAMLAAPWSVTDNGTLLDGGFAIWADGSGLWSSSYDIVYGEIGTHEINFSAQDLGHGGGHNYVWFELLGTTVVLDAVAQQPSTWGGIKRTYR